MNYKKIYDAIISNRKINAPTSRYTEVHHIVPTCMEGTNSRSNLVRLTAREHVLCHRLLFKIYPHVPGIIEAYWLMIHTRSGCTTSSKEFEILRTKKARLSSELLKESWKDPEFRERTIRRSKDQWKDPEFRERCIANVKIGMDSPDVRKKLSDSTKEQWKDPEFIKIMEEYWGDESNVRKRSDEMKSLWEREGFREESSKRVKELWEDEIYRSKIIESSKSNWKDPHLREQMTKSLIEFHKNTPTWRKGTSVSTQIYWSLARLFFNLSKYNPNCSSPMGYTEFCRVYDCGLHHNIYQRMLKRFSEGWIPQEDKEWMEDFDHYGFE